MHGYESLSGAALSIHHGSPTHADSPALTGEPLETRDEATTPHAADGEPTTGDRATLLMGRIHDTIGRLASLEFSIQQATDDEQRHAIAREMDALTAPLSDDVGGLVIETVAPDPDAESGRWDAELGDWIAESDGSPTLDPPEDTGNEAADPLTIGDVTLDRSPGRWRVYLIDTERDRTRSGAAEFANEHARRTEAMAWLRSWSRKPDGVSAVAVGPGDGPVTLRSLELFDDWWQVFETPHTPDADASLLTLGDGTEAKRIAERAVRKGGCPVIITPYKV